MNHFGSDERARLRALCEAATPGPWREGNTGNDDPAWVEVDTGEDGEEIGVAQVCDGPRRLARTGWSWIKGAQQQRANAALMAASRTAIPALLDALDLAEHEDGLVRARIARMEARRDEARAVLGAGDGVCYETLVDAARRVVAERDEARAEVLLARVGGVSAAFAGQSSREADAIQWGALRAENASLRERVAALEALVGVVS